MASPLSLATDTSAAPASLPPPLSPKASSARLHHHLTPWVVGLIIVLITLANCLIIPPLNRLLELNICREYYAVHDPSVIRPGGDVPEEQCKGNPIQTKLAELLGLITTLGIACELAVTFPLGYISDKYGRKTILIFNLSAQALSFGWVMVVGYFYNVFKITAIIAAPFVYLFGGSANVASTNLLAIIADVATNDLQRTKIFGFFQSAGQITQLLGPALAAVLMTSNLWIPFWIGIAAYATALTVVAILPDTRSPAVNKPVLVYPDPRRLDTGPEETSPLLPPTPPNEYDEYNDEYYGEPLSRHPAVERPTVLHTLRQALHNSHNMLKQEYADFHYLLTANKNVCLCLLAFLITTLAKTNLTILLQYVSRRYSLTLARAAYLLSLKAAVNAVLYTLIIPLTLNYLTGRWGYDKVSANVWGAKVSLSLLCIGAVLVGFSVRLWMLIISLVIYALGWALNLFMLSLLTHASFDILDTRHTARLYSAVGFVEPIGQLLGVPLLSAMWALGINVGGMGLGLPFWVCGGLYFVVGWAVWGLRFGM